MLCVKGIAASAIGAVGRDLYGVETAVATVDVVLAKSHVAFDRIVIIAHFLLLYLFLALVCANFKNNTIDI